MDNVNPAEESPRTPADLNVTFAHITSPEDDVFQTPVASPEPTATNSSKKGRKPTALSFQRSSLSGFPTIREMFAKNETFAKRKHEALTLGDEDPEISTSRRSKLTPRTPPSSAPTAALVASPSNSNSQPANFLQTASEQQHSQTASSDSQPAHSLRTSSPDRQQSLLEEIVKQLRDLRSDGDSRHRSLQNTLLATKADISLLNGEIRGIKEELLTKEMASEVKWSSVEARLSSIRSDQVAATSALDLLRDECRSRLSAIEDRAARGEDAGSKRSQASGSSVEAPTVPAQETLSASVPEARTAGQRSSNIIVNGLNCPPLESLKCLTSFLRSKFGYNGEVKITRHFGQPANLVVALDSHEERQRILRTKTEILRGSNVYINPDRNPKEARIFKKLREIAKEDKENRLPFRLHDDKILRGNKWWTWDEAEQRLIELQPRPRNCSDPTSSQQPPSDPRGNGTARKIMPTTLSSGTPMDLGTAPKPGTSNTPVETTSIPGTSTPPTKSTPNPGTSTTPIKPTPNSGTSTTPIEPTSNSGPSTSLTETTSNSDTSSPPIPPRN